VAIDIINRFGKKRTAILLAIAIAIPIIAITTISIPPPGIYIELNLLENINGRLRNLNMNSIGVAISILATAPPNYNGSDFVPIYAGRYSGESIYIPAEGKLLDISRAWEKEHRIHNAKIDEFEYGLIIFVHILNLTAIKNGDYRNIEISRYVDTITVKPIDIINGRAVEYRVSMEMSNKRITRTLSIGRKYLSVEFRIPGMVKIYAASSVDSQQSLIGDERRWCIHLVADKTSQYPSLCYERKMYIVPENMSRYLSQGYVSPCIPDSGRTCMKIPIMIIENIGSKSGVVTGAIGLPVIYRSNVNLVWAVGNFVESMYGAMPLVGSINVGGATISDFYRLSAGGCITIPNSVCWRWIFARPVYAIYSTYYVWLSEYISQFLGGLDTYTCIQQGMCVYTNDTAISSITYLGYAIESDGKKEIISNASLGYPPSALISFIFRGTSSSNATKLNVGEEITLADIIGKYGPSYIFGIGIPVGSIAAYFINAIASSANPALLEFVSAFSVGITQSTPMGIEGGLEGRIRNYGSVAGKVSVGYDVPVVVYVRVSSYEYVMGSYRFKVPIGIYFTVFGASA